MDFMHPEVERLSHEFWQGCAEEYGRLRQERLETMNDCLTDFLDDLLNYPLLRPWRESLDQFQEHYWQQLGLRLTPESYELVAKIIEREVNDPRCFAHGSIQLDATEVGSVRPTNDTRGSLQMASAMQAPGHDDTAEESGKEFHYSADEPIQRYIRAGAAPFLKNLAPDKLPIGIFEAPTIGSPEIKDTPDPKEFFTEAEELVSRYTNVPRNLPGPRQQTIPGSGPRGVRVLDLIHKGEAGSIRVRGTLIEVKASTSAKFNKLSGRSRQQIKDAVEFALRMRRKATLVKDPTIKSLLEKAHVEVFSDLQAPKSGYFFNLLSPS